MTNLGEQVLILVRIITVFYSIIPDCDEVFNYYEPLNFFIRGFGKQTWEYSPEYAIRSWAYLLPYSIPITPIAFVVDYFNLPNSITFYSIRLLIVSFTIYSELHLYRTLKSRWQEPVANWYLFFTTVSTGYSHAGVALLPSALAMNCATLATSNFLKFILNHSSRNALLVSNWFIIGGLFGWPFALFLALPSTLFILSDYYNDAVKYKRYFLWSIVAFFFYLVVIMEIDYHYYDKSVVVPLNIVLYNVIFADENSGPNIFGTEPLSYYIVNLLLNFNFIAILAYSGTILIPLVATFKKMKYGAIHLFSFIAPLALWSAVFFTQPHKEERFLYPVYSIINLSGAISISFIINLIGRVPSKRISSFLQSSTKFLVFCLIGSISILRTISLSQNYIAPLSIYSKIPNDAQGNLCVGREWYRYPSSFFLPQDLRLKFIKSNFNGLLPGDFDESLSFVKAVSKIPDNMNNLNIFEPSKLIEFDQCDYVIDIDQPVDEESQEIKMIDSNGNVKENWKLLESELFLNNEASSGIGRLLYIPKALHKLTKTNLVYHHYNLYSKQE